MAIRVGSPRQPGVPEGHFHVTDPLAGVLRVARLQVLRATVVICLLISIGNLVGSIAGFTATGNVSGPATLLAVAWCVLWALAAVFPQITARCFAHWQMTTLVLVVANTATIAATNGLDSPTLALCMYVGWIASVVVDTRAALLMSALMTGSIVAGFLLAGDSVADMLTGRYRYSAVSSAILPLLTGLVGVLLATVTNSTFSRLAESLHGLRQGAPATTPGLTALFAGRPVPALPMPSPDAHEGPRVPLTPAERTVVALLGDGYRAKQIALQRGVALSTVRSQIKAAKKKTGARTLEELVARADLER